MRLLHVNFHKGCELDVDYVFTPFIIKNVC